jgi:polyhydroxyalkanoate synthase
VLDAMSPANFPLMNPVVLERTVETHGENLVRGMERLAHDLEKGQLTHTDSSAFRSARTSPAPRQGDPRDADVPAIQYTPQTEQVLAAPLLIFPPWINRFYILDLNPKKSFVRWCVEQGITVFMVSWRSADESMAEVTWDDYVRAQIEAIELVRARLGVPAVHTIGYCVAAPRSPRRWRCSPGRGEAGQRRQRDLPHRASRLRARRRPQGVHRRRPARAGPPGEQGRLPRRPLHGRDLQPAARHRPHLEHVISHYLLGEDYPAFDLLHWNGDVTNLPAKWHEAYLRDCYRDNKLVGARRAHRRRHPGRLAAGRDPGLRPGRREDHIAPPESVHRMLDVLAGPVRFVLAGSGHIAGVVNPPAANKYGYWTGDAGRFRRRLPQGAVRSTRQLVDRLAGLARRARRGQGAGQGQADAGRERRRPRSRMRPGVM